MTTSIRLLRAAIIIAICVWVVYTKRQPAKRPISSAQPVFESSSGDLHLNSIAGIKTVDLDSKDGPVVGITIGLDIYDPATAPEFIATVAEKFKLQRTLSSPATSLLLVSIFGGITADSFKKRWNELTASDPILKHYMSLMKRAEVIHATESGQLQDSCSLIEEKGGGKGAK